MALTLTESLDNLYTTTWQNMKSNVADQVYNATPFWFWLKSKGKLSPVEGGRFLTEPLRFAKSDNIAWIGKGGTVSLADKEFLTVATYNWTYLVDSIVRFGTDDQQNRGKNQILDLMTAKLNNSKDSMVDEVETRLFVKDTSGTKMLSLDDIVPIDPTASVVMGGINGSTDTWWQNQYRTMTGVSFATSGIAYMNNMLNKCMNNLRQDRPDIIITSQNPYEYYEDAVIDQKRITNSSLGDAGFENIEYKGIPMIWSPSCHATRMYFLNTRFLTFKYDPMLNFDMTEWKPIPDQVNDRAAQVILAGQLCTGRRRVHGVLFLIDTV